MSSSNTFQRLPRTIIPLNYDILIQPHWDVPEPLGYNGTVRIQLEIRDGSTKEILLHSIGATLEHVVLEGSDGKRISPLGLDQSPCDVANELLRLKFGECLAQGVAVLVISFKAQFCDASGLGMKGMYRSQSSSSAAGGYNYLTFFAPTYCRNAFPAFDEPELKATFDVALVIPKVGGMIAVSNMPLKSEEDHPKNPDWIVKRFAKSPKMSTYLVSWMIGHFDCLEDTSTTSRVPCRVFTPVGKREQGEFALQVASKAIKFFDDYFSIPYPLPKLDLAAFGDFPCGAMENWGLITFREMVLLVDAQESSFQTRLRVGMTVSHEIAHSWFGNLVTMRWWTDLWLNEGFATFMQVMCYHSMVELDMWDHFQSSIAAPARELDSLGSSHPIEVAVNCPSDIDEIFDDISYKKGASIIAMLHDWIGDSSFRLGMSKYLAKYSYANAETAELWAELESASGKPVGKVMDTWTKQMGLPLLTVSNIRVDQDQVKATISGKRFRLEQQQESSAKSKWFVPLTFVFYSTTSSADGHENISNSGELLVEIEDGGKEQEITIPFHSGCQSSSRSYSLKLNRLGVGFYRCLYTDETNFHALGKLMQDKVLASQDRMNLLDDLFAVTVSGASSTKTLIEFLSYCKEEDNYFVWCRVSDILGQLINIFADNEEKLKQLKILGQNLFSKTATRLGWDTNKSEDSELDILLRSLSIRKMIEFESHEHLVEGKRRFQEFEERSREIPADLRLAVYKAMLFGGGIEMVEKLLKVYRKTDLLEEKLRILQSFQIIKDQTAQKFLLQFSISSEVRMQDVVSVMQAVSISNTFGRRMAWDFFKTNWQLFQKQFTGLFIIGSLVRGITENFDTQCMEQEIETFFQEHVFRGTRMPVQQALESIRIKRAWIERIRSEEQ